MILDIYLLGCGVALFLTSVLILSEVRIGKKLNWLDYVLLAIFVAFSWLSVIWFAYDAFTEWHEYKKWEGEE